MGTRDLGLTYRPSDHAIHCWADADFVGSWEKSIAMEDINTARSKSGYMITCPACSLVWASKMQTYIALINKEAENISLSTALREVISLIDLFTEIKQKVDDNITNLPGIHCRLFEDNSGAYELVTTPKMRPRTKHINVKYQHFRSYVERKLISIKKSDIRASTSGYSNKTACTRSILQTTQLQQKIKPIRERNYNSDSIFLGFMNNPNEMTLKFYLPFPTTHIYQCLVRNFYEKASLSSWTHRYGFKCYTCIITFLTVHI